MGSVVSGLLGGGGGSSGGSGGGTSTSYNLLPSNIKSAVDSYFSQAQNLSSKPYTPYTGQRIAPLSGSENRAIDYANQQFGSTLPVIQNANQVNQQLLNTASQGPTMENISQYMSPYQQAVTDQAKRNTIRNFEATTLPQVGRDAATAGAFGGSRQALMESEAYRNLNQNLTDIDERGLQQGFTNAQNQYFNTLNTASDINKNAVQTALYGQGAVQNDVNQLMQVGQQQRGISQAGLDTAYQDFLNEQNYPINALNILGGALSNTAPYFAPYQTQQQGGSGGSKGGDFLSTAIPLVSSIFGFNKGGSVKNCYAGGGLINALQGMGGINTNEDSRGIEKILGGEANKEDWISAILQIAPKIMGMSFAEGGSVKTKSNDESRWQDSLKGTVLGDMLGDTGQTITWDDGTTSKTKGSGLTGAVSDLLGGGNLDTEGLGDIFSQAAEDAKLVDKFNADTINQVGRNLSQVRFVDLTSPYANEQAQATGQVNSSRNNLFNYAEGGLISRNVGPAMEFLGDSYDALQRGKQKVLDNTLGKALDYLFAPTPEMQAEIDARRTKADELRNKNQEQKTPPPDVPRPKASVPSKTTTASLPNKSSKTSNPDSFSNLVQSVTKPVADTSSTQGSISDEYKAIIESLGLTPKSDQPRRQQSPILAGLLGALANSGSLSSGQLQAIAGTLKSSERQQKNEDKAINESLEQKQKAVALADKIQDQLAKREYNQVLREQMANSAANTRLMTQARLANSGAKKGLTDYQRLTTGLKVMEMLNNPTLTDEQKKSIQSQFGALMGGNPPPPTQPIVKFDNSGRRIP